MAHFELEVPSDPIDSEDAFYADEAVIDAGGMDLYNGGEYEMSVSWEGLDRAEVALAVLAGDDEPALPYYVNGPEAVASMDDVTDEELEMFAFIYLKALQLRNCEV